MTLSKRLQCIADMVEPGSRVADVGTDHGYIPIWLLTNGVCAAVTASDLRDGPLRRAMEHAEKAGVGERIRFILCPGLDGYEPAELDTVILAGMGGETIIEILSNAPWAREKTVIAQSQTKLYELRGWLNENGYRIVDAALVDDTGRIYVVWKLTAGPRQTLREVDRYVDPLLAEKHDPLLGPYIDWQIKLLRGKLLGLERAKTADEAALAACREALRGLQERRKELEHA